MAKPNVNADRVATMADQIRRAVLAIADDHRDMLAKGDAVKRISGEILITKLDIARDIAKLSTDEGWLPDEIDAACKRAGKGNADADESDERTQKTIGVICSEMRTVASPRVRAKFPVILASCVEAYEAENLERSQTDAEDRDMLDHPVHKFSKRLYNLVITIARAVKKDEASITCKEDLVDYCREHDPDFDEDKVAARIASVIKTVAKIASDFGDEEMTLTMEYLGTIDAKKLLASRTAMIERARAAAGQASSALRGDKVVAQAPTPPAKPAAVRVPPAPAPAADTSKVIDDLLGDNLANLKLAAD